MAAARWSSMNSISLALPPAPVRAKRYVGVRKKPSKRSTLSCSSGPLKTLPSRRDDDVAGRARQVLGLVVGELVGVDDHAAAAELDVAFGRGVEVGTAAHLARAQDDRQLPRRVAARRRLQRVGAAQLDAGAGAARRAAELAAAPARGAAAADGDRGASWAAQRR